MTLAAFADLAEVIGAFGVIAGLIFVGVQLHQNTQQMRRGEANSAMAQGSAIRLAIMADRDIAELLTAGVNGARPLDIADEMRLSMFFNEITYLGLQTWDRAKHGLMPEDEFERAIAPRLRSVLAGPKGTTWWTRSKHMFMPEFVEVMESAIPELRAQPASQPAPSAKAVEPAETAVAPPADAG